MKTDKDSLPETEIPVLCFWRDSHWHGRGDPVLDLTCTSCFSQTKLAPSARAESTGPCLSHPGPLMHMPGLLPELPFEPSPAEFQHHRLTVKERRLLLVTSVLLPGPLLRLTASSQWPHKAPSKTYLTAPCFPTPAENRQPHSHLSVQCWGLCWAGSQPC